MTCDIGDYRTDPGCWATPQRRPSLAGTIDVILHPGLYGTWWLDVAALIGVAVCLWWMTRRTPDAADAAQEGS